MTLAIETFDDLVHIIETHPEWRRRLKRALFDIDIEAALTRLENAIAELVETQRQHSAEMKQLSIQIQQQSVQIQQLFEIQSRQADDIHVLKTDVSQLKTDVSQLKTDVSQLKTDVSQLKTDVSGLKTDVSGLKTDVSSLKGKVYEQEYRVKASSIFGRFIRRGRDRTDDIADQLHEAVAAGQISEAELTQVLAADLLWGGKSRLDETELVVILEASWRAEANDVERAQRRAGILRRVGFQAVAVVAGTEWDGQALVQAQVQNVAIASNGQVNADSWRAALTAA